MIIKILDILAGATLHVAIAYFLGTRNLLNLDPISAANMGFLTGLFISLMLMYFLRTGANMLGYKNLLASHMELLTLAGQLRFIATAIAMLSVITILAIRHYDALSAPIAAFIYQILLHSLVYLFSRKS